MRIALVGLGAAGLDIHLPALADLDQATVVGGIDPAPERREEAERRFGIRTFDDFTALADAFPPDVVIVGTPPDHHAAGCLAAVEAGAHVICEKPFACSLAEADRVLEAAAASGRRVAVNLEFREMPIFRALLDRLRGGNVGDLAVVQAWQILDAPPGNEAGWRGRIPNRTLFEAGVHLVDLVLSAYGERPTAVTAAMSSGIAGSEGPEAVVFLTVHFADGRIAQVTQNRVSRGDRQYLELRADGTSGSLRASFGGRARVSAGLLRSPRPHLRAEMGASGVAWREEGGRRTSLARNPRHPEARATRRVFERSLAAFAADREPPIAGADGRNALEVIAAAYLSARLGRRVDLVEDAGAVHRVTMGRG